MNASMAEAAHALRQTQEFIADVSGPPETEEDHRRLTGTLHALDHASRLAEAARKEMEVASGKSDPDNARVMQLCADAMRDAALVAARVGANWRPR